MDNLSQRISFLYSIHYVRRTNLPTYILSTHSYFFLFFFFGLSFILKVSFYKTLRIKHTISSFHFLFLSFHFLFLLPESIDGTLLQVFILYFPLCNLSFCLCQLLLQNRNGAL